MAIIVSFWPSFNSYTCVYSHPHINSSCGSQKQGARREGGFVLFCFVLPKEDSLIVPYQREWNRESRDFRTENAFILLVWNPQVLFSWSWTFRWSGIRSPKGQILCAGIRKQGSGEYLVLQIPQKFKVSRTAIFTAPIGFCLSEINSVLNKIVTSQISVVVNLHCFFFSFWLEISLEKTVFSTS